MAGHVVLVAGAGGFLGGHLVAALRGQGEEVRAVDRRPLAQWRQSFGDVDNQQLDLCDRAQGLRACVGVRTIFDVMATGSGSTADDPMLAILPHAHLLQAARERLVRRYCLAASLAGAAAERTAAADWPAPVWAAAWLERLCRQMADAGLATRVARVGALYGPRAGQGVFERGCADGARPLFVDDAVAGLLALVDSARRDPAVLVGGECVGATELASLLAAEGIALPDVSMVQQDGADLLPSVDFGWRPTTVLADGVRRTAAFLREQPLQRRDPVLVPQPRTGRERAPASTPR